MLLFQSVQLQEETLQLKYCSIRCAALHKQKTQLQTSYDCCLNTLNKFKQQWRQEFTEFCMAVPPFIASYGLLSYNRGGAGGGEGLLKKELEKLSEEERFLKSNLKNYEENLAKLTKLSEQQQQLQNQLEQLGRTLEGVLEEEKVLADRVVKLTEEKQEVDCKPKTDPYFVGLHSETVTLHRDYDQLRKRYEEKVSQLKRMQQNHNRHRTKFQKT
ncbi:eukaryotic translation initiation factor 3 subunit A-like [Argonauta hians]